MVNGEWLNGLDATETGHCHQTSALAVGDVVVEVSQDFYRSTDVVNLWGDPTKAKAKLGWNPNKTSFEELVNLNETGGLFQKESVARNRVNGSWLTINKFLMSCSDS